MLSSEAKSKLQNGEYDEKITLLCAGNQEDKKAYCERLIHAIEAFEALYGAKCDISVFSAPGRTEIGGNHTDHQHGRVLAASINLDVIAVASKNADTAVRVKSEGFDADEIDISQTKAVPGEKNCSSSLLRGICARFLQKGYPVGGFNAYTTSNVLTGSGLSSSAAFEVLIGTLLNVLYAGGKETALSIAQIGQYAENVYFGKPCGLMDQAASSVGGFIQIDFKEKERPEVQKIDFDFAKSGYVLCIIDTKGNHSDLTPDYAAIPAEMKAVAACFGKEVLREVDEAEFFSHLAEVREKTGDRAALRAIHFFGDNARVLEETTALRQGDFSRFQELIIESGNSSYQYLQNVFSPAHPEQQGVSLALALCERLLKNRGGAWRVHGGGFAGTVQAFVPLDYLPEFIEKMEAVTGKGSCHSLRIRPVGGTQIL